MTNLLGFVVEDDPDLSVIFSEALQAAGFEVEVISSGDQALVRLAEVVPDVVILDLHLPKRTGVDIMHEIRRDPRLKNTRVIIATAHPRMAETLRDEADLILLKPVSFSQLRDLAAILGKGPRDGD